MDRDGIGVILGVMLASSRIIYDYVCGDGITLLVAASVKKGRVNFSLHWSFLWLRSAWVISGRERNV